MNMNELTKKEEIKQSFLCIVLNDLRNILRKEIHEIIITERTKSFLRLRKFVFEDDRLSRYVREGRT